MTTMVLDKLGPRQWCIDDDDEDGKEGDVRD